MYDLFIPDKKKKSYSTIYQFVRKSTIFVYCGIAHLSVPQVCSRPNGDNIVKSLSQIFIADTIHYFLNSMSVSKPFCVMAYRNQNFTVT